MVKEDSSVSETEGKYCLSIYGAQFYSAIYFLETFQEQI